MYYHYWNYRVVRKIVNHNHYHGIYEVYYDDNDEIKNWSKDPLAPIGENLADLKDDIELMQKAFKMPVLTFDENGRLTEEKSAV